MQRAALILCLCLLLGLLANTIVSSALLARWPSNRQAVGGTPRDDLIGGPWPLPPPGAWSTPWPAPTSWWEWQRFGLRGIDARHVEQRQSRFSMTVMLSGWPLPTHYSQQIWWPGDDPAFAYSGPTHILCHVLPVGMILNPLIFAIFAWTSLFAIPSTLKGYVRHLRATCRLCPYCAYPLGSSPVCTECGKPIPTGSNHPTTSPSVAPPAKSAPNCPLYPPP